MLYPRHTKDTLYSINSSFISLSHQTTNHDLLMVNIIKIQLQGNHTVKIDIVRENGHGLLSGFSCLLRPMTMQWTNKTFQSEQEHIQNQKATSMGHWMDIHPPHPGINLFNFIVFFKI